MTLDELDRLHAAATAGEWKDHGDESVRWDDPMACGYDSRAHHRGPPYYCTGPRCATVEGAEADASAIVALHNAWPAISARLRAAEAEVKRLRGLVRWFLDGDDHTHADDCGARGQHDRDVCRVAGCGDAECEGPHCTCDATEMRDAARAALGEP